MAFGIAILFPGTGYTCKEKLFAECANKYRSFGYRVVELDFSKIPFKEIETIEEAFERAKRVVLEQLSGIQFAAYRDVVFLSKSFGTVCAGWLADTLQLLPRQIYLTPAPQALAYVGPGARVEGMVIGTKDRVMDSKALQAFCRELGIPCLVFARVGHDLKADGDAERTGEVNRRILELCTVDEGVQSEPPA